MSMLRHLVAFLVSPWAVVLPLAFRGWRNDLHAREPLMWSDVLTNQIVMHASVVYALAFILGVPMLAFLHVQRWTDPWQVAIAGAAVGVASWLVVAGRHEAAAKSVTAVVVVFFSAVAGFVYWSIAYRRQTAG